MSLSIYQCGILSKSKAKFVPASCIDLKHSAVILKKVVKEIMKGQKPLNLPSDSCLGLIMVFFPFYS
jgi:hypothetical protein